MSEVKGDRTGTRIPGSGTSAIPTYACATCRDSGVLHQREIAMDVERGLMRREYVTKPCPNCDGKPRLAGEVLDAA